VCRYSPAGNMMGAFAQNVLAPAGAVQAYVSCADGGGGGGGGAGSGGSGSGGGSGSKAASAAPSATPSPGAFPVSVRVRSVVRGYSLATFMRDVFLAALAKTLGVDVARLVLRDVQSAAPRRQAGDGVVATADVGYPAGTDAKQVL
jgi:hypothetical protein